MTPATNVLTSANAVTTLFITSLPLLQSFQVPSRRINQLIGAWLSWTTAPGTMVERVFLHRVVSRHIKQRARWFAASDVGETIDVLPHPRIAVPAEHYHLQRRRDPPLGDYVDRPVIAELPCRNRERGSCALGFDALDCLGAKRFGLDLRRRRRFVFRSRTAPGLHLVCGAGLGVQGILHAGNRVVNE